MPSVEVPSPSHIGGKYTLTYDTPPAGWVSAGGQTIQQLEKAQEPVQTASQEIRTGEYNVPKPTPPTVERYQVTTQAQPVLTSPYPQYTQVKQAPVIETKTEEFGLGVTKKVQANAPLISDRALTTPEGRFANVGRMAIVAGASTIDLAGELGKDTLKGDFGKLGYTLGQVAYGATVGTVLTAKDIGGKAISGDIGGAAKQTTEFGVQLGVTQSFFSFGKGFAKQGIAVAKSGFSPKRLAESYGPTSFVGFAEKPLAGARAKTMLEPFRSAPSFSALSERSAYTQARPIAISLTPPIGKVTGVPAFSPKGIEYQVELNQFSGMYEPAKFPVKTKPMLTEKGVMPSIGVKELEGKFIKSEFQETAQYTPKGVETVTVKKLDFTQPPKTQVKTYQKPSDTDPFNLSAVKVSETQTGVTTQGEFERQTRRFENPLYIEKPSAIKIARPEVVTIYTTSASTSLNKTTSLPVTENVFKPIQKYISINPPATLTNIIGKTIEAEDTKTNVITMPRIETATRTESAYKEVLSPKEITQPKYGQPTTKLGLSLEIPKKVFPFGKDNLKFSGASERLARGFSVFVRRRGKFQAIPGVFTKARAINLGASLVSSSAAATFKVRPAGLTAELSGGRTGFAASRFYTPKTIKRGVGEELYTQKTRYRISSLGEKQEITAKGLQALRNKRKVFY